MILCRRNQLEAQHTWSVVFPLVFNLFEVSKWGFNTRDLEHIVFDRLLACGNVKIMKIQKKVIFMVY